MKRAKKQPKWMAISSTTVNAPGVDATKLRPGRAHPQVVVTQLLDDEGRHWERWGTDEPRLVGAPPDVNEKGG